MKHANRRSITIASVVFLVPVGALLAALTDESALPMRGVCCGGEFALIGGLERGDGPVLTGGSFALAGGLWKEQTPATPATLTAIELRSGGTLIGDVGALGESDDVSIHAQPDPNAATGASEILIRAVTHVQSPILIDLALDSRISEPGGSVEILMNNWKMDAFDTVGFHGAGVLNRTTTIEDIAALNYINDAGEIEILIRHRVEVSFFRDGLRSSIDRITIGVE